MVKKINFILVLLLLLVSVGAVSAADDANNTVGVDEAIDDISDSNEVLTSDVVDEVVSSTSNSYTINESSYSTYFNSNGETSSLVKSGDTINIDGQISNKNFTFKTPVNVVGTSSNNLKNCIFTFYSGASGSNISSLKIANTINYHYGIFLNGVSKCVIKSCIINNRGTSSYAICVANGANYNNVTDNKISTAGPKEGYATWSTTPLLVSGSHYNYIANNNVACDDVNAIYLSSYSGGPLKGGNSNFNTIYNNTVKYNVLPTSWAYGIQLMGSNNIVDSNTVIGAYLGISGSNCLIVNNKIINITGADYNHIGTEVGGDGAIAVGSDSIVRNNTIINAKISSTGAGISINKNCIVQDNFVQVVLSGIGIKVSGTQSVPNITIKNNNISTVSGAAISNDKVWVQNFYVIDNTIVSQSGVGVLIQKNSPKKMPGNITIVGNIITTNNAYSINAAEADSSMFWDISGNSITNKNAKINTPEGVYDPSKQHYNYKGVNHLITSENYDEYIDVNGGLSSKIDDGDILRFSGEFSNKYIYLNKAIKLVGNNSIFYNTTFRVISDGVWIENLTILNNRAERINAWGVLVYNVTSATILNCTIDVYDPNAAYAIYILESSGVDVINNTLSSEGNYLTYTILANAVFDCNFKNNVIFTNGTEERYQFEKEHCLEGNSACTDGNTCTDGNSVCPDGNSACTDGNTCTDGNSVCTSGNSAPGSHVLKEVYRTYGILMVYSSDNVVSNNHVTVTSKLNQTYSPNNSTNSLVGIDLYYDSHNNIFSENNVYVYGKDNYLYGMGVLGYYTTMLDPEGRGAVNNQFIKNNIILEGNYCVEGLIIGSSSKLTLMDGNIVNARSTNVSYGITLEMSQDSIIKNNNVTLNSQTIYGIEAFSSNNNQINKNEFNINGSQALGVAISNGNYNDVKSNKLFLNLDGDGLIENASTKHYDIIGTGYAGIYLRAYSSNNSIDDNNITILKGYAIILDDGAIDNIISNNYLSSPNGTGNDAINSTVNNTVENNYYYLVTGILSDINIKYLENGTFRFETTNPDLNGAIVKFYDFEFNELNSTVLSEGWAEFKYHFSYYYLPGSYKVYAKVFKENFKVTEFEADSEIGYGDLNIVVSNSTGPIARNAQFNAVLKNILGDSVQGITVEFYVDDEGYEVYIGKAITDNNGLASLLGVIPQIYEDDPTIIAKVNDPADYNSISGTANLTAFWLTKTNLVLNNDVYPNGVLAILKDQYGNTLPNKFVSVKIGSNNYNLVTNSKGEVTMPILSKGSYVVSVSFAGDDQYYDSKNSGKVVVLASLLENKDSTVYYGNTIKYKVRVRGSDGSYGAGRTVIIKVNGQTFKVVTDSNGYATKALKLKTGTYTVTAEFNGDSVVNKLTFKPTLTAKNIVKKKAKKIKFSVKVVNKNGKALKKKKVTFKIKGKKYTAKTNKKGVATVSIKNLNVGKYTITSSYGGCTIKNIIKIKK